MITAESAESTVVMLGFGLGAIGCEPGQTPPSTTTYDYAGAPREGDCRSGGRVFIH